MCKTAGSMVLAALLMLSAPGWAKEISSFKTHTWDAGAYANDTTGEFSHCAASAEYKSGVLVIASVTKELDWYLAFSKSSWIPNRVVNSLSYRFDGGKWETVKNLSVSDGNTIYVDMPESYIVQQFRRAKLMEIFVLGERYGFELGGSSGMLADLVLCVKVNKEAATASASSPPPSKSSEEHKTPAANTEQNADAPKKGEKSSGSGLIISDTGHVLTNSHVVEGCELLRVVGLGQLPQAADTLYQDQENDLAVVKVREPGRLSSVAKFRTERPKLGESISVFGFPLTGALSSSGNFVIGTVSSLAGLGDDARILQISAPIQPGNSGGPLLDQSGNVIGIVSSKLNEIKFASATGSLPQNVNFSIKANVAMNFLDAHSIPYLTTNDGTALESSKIAEAAKGFTVQVLCN